MALKTCHDLFVAKLLSKLCLLTAATALGFGTATLTAVAQERHYVLATATVGGTFYPVGVAISTLVKVKLHPGQGIDMTAVKSAGSGENVRLLRENQAQFAILSGLTGYLAWAGKEQFSADGPYKELRSVSALWPEAEHFVVRRQYVETGTIEDMQNLKGRPVSLGLQSSGTIALNRALLGKLGFEIERDFELVYLGYDASAEALQKGQIEAMSTSGGVPVLAVVRAMAAPEHELVILEFTDEQLQKINSGLDLWTRYVIEGGTYPSQNRDIETVATLSLLAVRADTDEDAVYRITKTIHENLSFLQTIHGALSDLSLYSALDGLPVPLHPGALRYYREAGLDIPRRLLPD